jgi:hypothetical protein
VQANGVDDVTEVKHVMVNDERDTSDYVKKLKVPYPMDRAWASFPLLYCIVPFFCVSCVGAAFRRILGGIWQAKEIRLVLELTNSLDETFYIARRAAIDFSIPLVTNVEQVTASNTSKYLYSFDQKFVLSNFSLLSKGALTKLRVVAVGAHGSGAGKVRGERGRGAAGSVPRGRPHRGGDVR